MPKQYDRDYLVGPAEESCCEHCGSIIRKRRLLEVEAEDLIPNYGLEGSVIREVIVRDCVTEEVLKLRGGQLAACEPPFSPERSRWTRRRAH